MFDDAGGLSCLTEAFDEGWMPLSKALSSQRSLKRFAQRNGRNH